ncbi:hypothetical protein G9A89_000314 [Geosiphon pyriformis]|nr:hypothetical protein G9A89_000314 [Geosiphon pyriformis]
MKVCPHCMAQGRNVVIGISCQHVQKRLAVGVDCVCTGHCTEQMCHAVGIQKVLSQDPSCNILPDDIVDIKPCVQRLQTVKVLAAPSNATPANHFRPHGVAGNEYFLSLTTVKFLAAPWNVMQANRLIPDGVADRENFLRLTKGKLQKKTFLLLLRRCVQRRRCGDSCARAILTDAAIWLVRG